MSQPIRFGPFEVHLTSGELRRNGRLVRIQDQPFQILAALLEHPGDVVTREQLRERLWPGDSFGDFDQGLNTAINKLREALGDSSADPKFIETLPKRGYRFSFPLAPLPVVQPPSRRTPIIAACLACAALGAIAGWFLHPSPTTSLPPRKWTIQTQEPLHSYPHDPGISISPDGRHIVGIAKSSGTLWLHRLDRQLSTHIPGTAGAATPFWSPDSSTIAYVANGALMKVPVNGGAPTRLASLPLDGNPWGGTWSRDGVQLVVAIGNPSQLFQVPANGGTPTPLFSPEAVGLASRLVPNTSPGYFWAPHFMPTPGRIAFSLGYLNPTVVIQDWKTGEAYVVDQGTSPTYVAPGYLIYARTSANDVWAQPLSRQGRKSGAAFRVTEKCILPSVSNDQTLVCVEAPHQDYLAWFDRHGNRTQNLGQPSSGIFYPALSPDDRHVAMETLENANMDIWVLDVKLGTRQRLTTHQATDIIPAWSPDGNDVAFSSYRSGSIDVWMRPADARNEETLIHGTSGNERVSDWSKDGKYIVFTSIKGNQRDIRYLARTDGKWIPKDFLSSSANEHTAKFSPDSRYVAYLSDESGRTELYVREFPDGGRKWIISSQGASQPRWSRDGKEIFYAANGTLNAVAVTTKTGFSAAAPVPLFAHTAFDRSESEPHYDVSLDRKRVLLPDPVDGANTRIQVIQNWLSAAAN